MITIRSHKSLDQLSNDLEKAVADNGFSVLTVHDLQAKLKAKGVPLEHTCRIYEVCNPQQAKAVLDRELAISTVLPCRISLYDKGDEFELATLEPTQQLAAFARPDLEPIAKEVENVLRRILAAAAGP
jgi:uncharacterized protein (DUF302 family)